MGNILTVMGMSRTVMAVASSDNPLVGLMGLLGFPIDEQTPEYTLQDLRAEMQGQFDQPWSYMDQVALLQAGANSQTARVQITRFIETPDAELQNSLIENADRGLIETIGLATGGISTASSLEALSRAILAVTEALAVRMAVVEIAEDSAFGKDSVQQRIARARDFFARAEGYFETARENYIGSDPVDVGYSVDRHNGRMRKGFEFDSTLDGDEVQDVLRDELGLWQSVEQSGGVSSLYI